MTYRRTFDDRHKLCASRYEAVWAPDARTAVFGRGAEDEWRVGFTKVVRTVGRLDGKAEPGRVAPVGGG
ncbi:hypothetical protein [Streptomyces sp. NPDC051561]|uniref:hypothetical protein n=1 Tax=Streptomyces sp. NPDC051561 TaxID=3365658 RepID=UPI0037B98D9C